MEVKLTLEAIENPKNNLGYKIEKHPWKTFYEWEDENSFLGVDFIFYSNNSNVFLSSLGRKIETIEEAINLGLPFKKD